MKLTARDTDTFLKAPDRQVKAVLLYGPDQGLVRERSRLIAGLMLGKDADPLNLVEMTGDRLLSDPAMLRDELAALSLMGGRRLAVLRNAGDKTAAIIASAFEGLATTTYLIVEGEELSPSSGLRHLFEKEVHFAALACYRDEGRNLEAVIRSTLAGFNLRATQDALQYLAEHLGNDRGVTTSELEKIACYMGQEHEVTLSIAQELVGYNASETIDDMCHAVASGAVAQAQSLLARLLHEGVQPVAIIRALLRHFQRLDWAAARIAGGESPDQAVAALRPPVFFKYAPLVRQALSRWRPRAILQAQNLLLRTEKDLKSNTLSPALLASHAIQRTAQLAA